MSQNKTVAAAEADRLRQDPAFQEAVLAYRRREIELLIKADATDADAIRTHQANIRAVDGICAELALAIAAAPRKPMAVA